MSEYDALITAAKQACENAYAPFSNFRVGAAVRAKSGRIFTGCNVENATLGLTCAPNAWLSSKPSPKASAASTRSRWSPTWTADSSRAAPAARSSGNSAATFRWCSRT